MGMFLTANEPKDGSTCSVDSVLIVRQAKGEAPKHSRLYLGRVLQVNWANKDNIQSGPCHSEQKSLNQRFFPYRDSHIKLEPFLGLKGQQTNSTPEKTSMPQGNSIAKLLTLMPRSRQAPVAVLFHWSKSQHLVWLWMWSKRQCSGTRRASLWKGPAGVRSPAKQAGKERKREKRPNTVS